MFWLGLLVGLVIGASAGVALFCVMTSRRNYDLCEALDMCRRELSWLGCQSGNALWVCANATKVLNDNGWMVEASRQKQGGRRDVY